MTSDSDVKDSAREPEREALGTVRGGIRAAAKKAAKKITKKPAPRKTTARKTVSTGKAARKTTKTASKQEKPAAAKTAPARASAARARAAAAGTAVEAGAGSGAAAPAAATAPEEAVAPIESPRPPAPMHPGATMESTQEHGGGLGSMLALWGPLIIVGFLVLVFRGGEERDGAVEAATDVSARSTTTAPGPPPAGVAGPSEQALGYPGAGRRMTEAFDGGFPMRTSMASPPAWAGRGPGAGMPADVSGRLYPSPPGPYRDPRYRGLPTGESWPSGGAGEWLWPAEGREGPSYDNAGDAPAQWVRCAPPYYWCPAPGSPAW